MNKRWCEGLDWIRVDDLLEIAPDVYVQILADWLRSVGDVRGDDAERELHEEILRRLRTQYDVVGYPTDYTECILEALRIVAEQNNTEVAQLEKLLRRARLRVVQP